MPFSKLHKKKRTKNFLILALVFGWCLLIYFISIIKMANASGMPDKYKNQRERHQQNIEKFSNEFERGGVQHQKDMVKKWESYNRQGEKYIKDSEKRDQSYTTRGEKHTKDLDSTLQKYERDATKHQKEIDAAIESWWFGDKQSEQAKEIMKLRNEIKN